MSGIDQSKSKKNLSKLLRSLRSLGSLGSFRYLRSLRFLRLDFLWLIFKKKNDETFEECLTTNYIQSIKDQCKCLPMSLQPSDKVY